MDATGDELLCAACRERLLVDAELTCTRCGFVYADESDVVTLLPDGPLPAAASAQASWFDGTEDPEYEISRPHGTPRFHAWLLEEKLRRATAELSLRGACALAVCGGSGMDSEFLSRLGARVVSVDISSGAARRAAERARRYGAPFVPVVADAERLPFADGSFDLVLVHDGLHHLGDPVGALREMARVSRFAVSVSEPADAALTRLAVRMGLAAEREEAGNRVARLTIRQIGDVLREQGLVVTHAERYAMLYRHEAGFPVRFFSRPAVFPVAVAAVRLLNLMVGSFGNKLAVIAIKP